MRHRKLQELIGAYADGELRAADRSRVEKHLKACPSCRKDLEFIRALEERSVTSPSVPREAEYWASFPGRVRDGIARRQPGAPVSRIKEVEMFQDSFYVPESRAGVRAAVFPLSLAAHPRAADQIDMGHPDRLVPHLLPRTGLAAISSDHDARRRSGNLVRALRIS